MTPRGTRPVTLARRAARLMSLLLIGLGVAIFLRTMLEGGAASLQVGHLVGIALTAAGAARLRMLSSREADQPDEPSTGGQD